MEQQMLNVNELTDFFNNTSVDNLKHFSPTLILSVALKNENTQSFNVLSFCDYIDAISLENLSADEINDLSDFVGILCDNIKDYHDFASLFFAYDNFIINTSSEYDKGILDKFAKIAKEKQIDFTTEIKTMNAIRKSGEINGSSLVAHLPIMEPDMFAFVMQYDIMAPMSGQDIAMLVDEKSLCDLLIEISKAQSTSEFSLISNMSENTKTKIGELFDHFVDLERMPYNARALYNSNIFTETNRIFDNEEHFNKFLENLYMISEYDRNVKNFRQDFLQNLFEGSFFEDENGNVLNNPFLDKIELNQKNIRTIFDNSVNAFLALPDNVLSNFLFYETPTDKRPLASVLQSKTSSMSEELKNSISKILNKAIKEEDLNTLKIFGFNAPEFLTEEVKDFIQELANKDEKSINPVLTAEENNELINSLESNGTSHLFKYIHVNKNISLKESVAVKKEFKHMLNNEASLHGMTAMQLDSLFSNGILKPDSLSMRELMNLIAGMNKGKITLNNLSINTAQRIQNAIFGKFEDIQTAMALLDAVKSNNIIVKTENIL